nr:CoA transferase [Virgisporangium aurantiacum]
MPAELAEIFRQRTVDEWLRELYAASIPCGPVNDVAAALADGHTAARGLVVTTEHPRYAHAAPVGVAGAGRGRRVARGRCVR